MRADPALVSAVIAGLNKAIAGALKYDPGTQHALQALNGKVLQINCTAPEFSLYAVIDAGEVRLHSHYEHTVHCTLTGSSSALIGLLWQDHHSLARSGVTVRGEPGLLNSIQQLLKQLDIDWQESLSDIFGDTVAFPLIHLIGSQGLWLRQRAQRLPDWVGDVLTEELRLLPSANELELFYQDVNDLRTDCERLQARIKKLRSMRAMTNDRTTP